MTIAHVANTYYTTNGTGNAGYTTPAINTTGANFLVMALSSYGDLSSTWNSSYLSDSKGNTWTFLPVTGNNLAHYGGIAYCINPVSVGSDHTISLAANEVTTYGSLAFMAFSGVANDPYQTQTSADGTSSIATVPSITPAMEGQLFICRWTFWSTDLGADIDSGFITTVSTNYVGGAHMGAAIAYYIATNESSIQPTLTETGVSHNGASCAAFKPAVESFAEIDVVWGHDTGVSESTIRNFSSNWTGTGTVDNPGTADTERLALAASEYMISEVVHSGAVKVKIQYNVYAAGDTINLDYRHGATSSACTSAEWQDYTGSFESLGYLQVKVTSTL